MAHQREQSGGREADAVDRVADPDAPLEEVVTLEDLGIEIRSIFEATYRY
ncbi:MAG TPA: hypothetical protein VGG74_12685 [Kofleriaceae bacterium]